MVIVKKGDIVATSSISKGVSQKGKAWGRFEVKAEKGYDKISCWIDNIETLQDTGNLMQINEILEIKRVHRPYTDKQGNKQFTDDFVANVTLIGYSGGEVEGFTKVEGFSKIDDDLPF